MASPARFTFDLDLGSHPRAKTTPPPAPSVPESLVAELVRQAREDGFAEGLVEGAHNAEAMAAQTIAAAAGTLATQTAQLTAALDAAMDSHRREAVDLAASIGRKLALHLLARFPTVEIDALITECMASLNGVPHLVIRCHPDLADRIRDTATTHMATSGFTGRLIVMGDPDIRIGDGRLEWVDGGLVRDLGAISGEIDRQIASFLAASSRDRTKESGT